MRTGKRFFLCCRKSDSPERSVRRRPCIRGRDEVKKCGKISPHKQRERERETETERAFRPLYQASSSFPLAHHVVVILLSSREVETPSLRPSPFDGFLPPALRIRFRGKCIIAILFIGDDDDDDDEASENAGETNSACWKVLHFDDERRKG